MSFTAAVDHLHALGLELAPPDAAATAPRRKFDLDHMRILAHALGDPQHQFPAVLIAGTNGKGSTAASLASILAAAGYRTGLYTSPHLSRVTERIRIGTSEIPEDAFARLYFRVDEAAQLLVDTGQLPHHPSFFESLTALAFLYFAEQKLDIAILEVGLGGRLDATNIVEPVLSIITDIALDHQDYLGNTIPEIAREKAGILRPNGTLITLPQHPEANHAIGEIAIALNVRGINAAAYLPDRNSFPGRSALPTHSSAQATALRISSGLQPAVSHVEERGALAPEVTSPLHPNQYDLILDHQLLQIRSPLPGQHQQRNIALAIAAAIELRNPSSDESTPSSDESTDQQPAAKPRYNIPNSAIQAGIAHTAWPGRLEFLPPNLLLDVAHNPAGAWTLRAAIATLPDHQPRTLIFSCLRDKDLAEMAQILFPLFDSDPLHHIILAPIHNPRAASLDDLLAAAQALDIHAHPAHDPAEALALARSLTPANGLILATGSVYLIGALRDAILTS